VRSFDLGVLQPWAAALRQPRLKQLLQQQPGTSWACIDTLQVVKKVQQLQNRMQRPDPIAKLQKVNLQALREHFGIEKNNAHRCVDSIQFAWRYWVTAQEWACRWCGAALRQMGSVWVCVRLSPHVGVQGFGSKVLHSESTSASGIALVMPLLLICLQGIG
jgi:hypothetical protein